MAAHTHRDKHAMGLSCLLIHTRNPVLVVSMCHLGCTCFVDRICGTSFSEMQARALLCRVGPFFHLGVPEKTALTAVFLSE